MILCAKMFILIVFFLFLICFLKIKNNYMSLMG